MGPFAALRIALMAALAGGVLAVVVLVNARYVRAALANLVTLVRHWAHSGLRPVPGMTLADAKSPRLPYAIPIAVGLMVTLWLR